MVLALNLLLSHDAAPTKIAMGENEMNIFVRIRRCRGVSVEASGKLWEERRLMSSERASNSGFHENQNQMACIGLKNRCGYHSM